MNRELFISDFKQLSRLHSEEDLPSAVADYVKNMPFIPGHSELEQLIQPDIIIELCCQHYGMSIEKMALPDRCTEIRHPRQVCMYLLASRSPLAHRQIGRLFNRDRTTVTATWHRIDREMEVNKVLRHEIAQLNAQL